MDKHANIGAPAADSIIQCARTPECKALLQSPLNFCEALPAQEQRRKSMRHMRIVVSDAKIE